MFATGTSWWCWLHGRIPTMYGRIGRWWPLCPSTSRRRMRATFERHTPTRKGWRRTQASTATSICVHKRATHASVAWLRLRCVCFCVAFALAFACVCDCDCVRLRSCLRLQLRCVCVCVSDCVAFAFAFPIASCLRLRFRLRCVCVCVSDRVAFAFAFRLRCVCISFSVRSPCCW
jgi:hypothetical protein